MGNLRRRVQRLQARFYCPVHGDEPLLCSECDIMELTDDEWDELALLLEHAGFFDREPLESLGTCWRCQEGRLACSLRRAFSNSLGVSRQKILSGRSNSLRSTTFVTGS
jgi:hypothetical protein